MDGTLWQRLVAERGWPDKRFAAWLGRLWTSQLVKPRQTRLERGVLDHEGSEHA